LDSESVKAVNQKLQKDLNDEKDSKARVEEDRDRQKKEKEALWTAN